MSRKHLLSEHEYTRYRKRHRYDDVLAEEEAKIARELAQSEEQRQDAEQRLQRHLREVLAGGDPELLQQDETLSRSELAAKREIRNARTHKRRHKGLAAHEGKD